MAGRKDDGFTLVEVLTSLAVIGIVLSAVTTFFVRSMITIDVQGARQAAIQVASDAMEQLRQIPVGNVVTWLGSPASAAPVTVNSISYSKAWTTGTTVASLLNVTVRVAWDGKDCPGGVACSYLTTTQISTSSDEPLFKSTT